MNADMSRLSASWEWLVVFRAPAWGQGLRDSQLRVPAPLPAQGERAAQMAQGQGPCLAWGRRPLLGKRNENTEEREGQAAFCLHNFQAE